MLGIDALVAVGEFGTVLVSTDNGLNWTETIDSTINGTDLNAVTFGNGSFVAAATANEVFTSVNKGATWSLEVLPIPNTLTVKFQGISYFNGLFVAAGNDHFIVSKSTVPGSTWTVNIGADYVNSSLYAVTAANGSFIAVGQSGHILQTNGLAGALPQIKVTPTALGFGSILQGKASASQTITIANIGSSALNVGSLALTGINPLDFSITNNSCSAANLAPAASCTVDVAFNPAATGARNAGLAIPSNDPDTATVTVPVEGSGLPSFLLTATNAGDGSGSVASNPAGIAIISGIAGASQAAVFAPGSSVTLTATADVNSNFAGWSGGPNAGTCSGTVTPCTVTMDAAKSIVATFNPKQVTITASAGANGSVSPAGPVAVTFGGSKTFAINPNPGFAILDVSIDSGSQGPVASFTFPTVITPAPDHRHFPGGSCWCPFDDNPRAHDLRNHCPGFCRGA